MLPPLSKQLFKNLAQDLGQALSQRGAALPQSELQALLQAALGRLNLVTREEFDAQVAVLQRTREKIERLEKELAALQQTGTAVTAVQNDSPEQ